MLVVTNNRLLNVLLVAFVAVSCHARDPAVAGAHTAGEEDEVEGVRLCWCPAGSFKMGSPEGEAGRRSDEALVDVKLTKGFWMGKYEVTQGQWRRVVGALHNPSGRVMSPHEMFSTGHRDARLAAGLVPMTWDARPNADLSTVGRVDASQVFSAPIDFEIGDATNGKWPLCGRTPAHLGSEAVIAWRRIHDAAQLALDEEASDRAYDELIARLKREGKAKRDARKRKRD